MTIDEAIQKLDILLNRRNGGVISQDEFLNGVGEAIAAIREVIGPHEEKAEHHGTKPHRDSHGQGSGNPFSRK